MTIQSDFNMYYRNSLIGVRRGSSVEPFYVHRVDARGNENNIENLRYAGSIITNSQGRVEEFEATQSQVVTALPDIGYVKPGRSPIWLSYRAVRANCKGVNMDRLVADNGFELDHKMMYSIYHPHFDGRFDYDSCAFEGGLHYRGARIGDFRGDSTFTLPRNLEYLAQSLEQVTSCRSIIVGR